MLALGFKRNKIKALRAGTQKIKKTHIEKQTRVWHNDIATEWVESVQRKINIIKQLPRNLLLAFGIKKHCF